MDDDWVRHMEDEANIAARIARTKRLRLEHAKFKEEDRHIKLWFEEKDRERMKGSGQKDFFRKGEL